MSNSVRPHRRQPPPTRLPHPWDSPGKNTGVGCHFLLQFMKVKSESEVIQSCPTLSDPMDCSLPGSSIHGIFQARVLGWGAIAFSFFLLLTIFLAFQVEKSYFESYHGNILKLPENRQPYPFIGSYWKINSPPPVNNLASLIGNNLYQLSFSKHY